MWARITSWLRADPRRADVAFVAALVAAAWIVLPIARVLPRMNDGWRIGLGVAALLLVPALRHLGAGARRHWRLVVLGGAALIFALAVHGQAGRNLRDLVRGRFVQTWNVFHYYMGAKYFDELGYDDLYAYVLRADAEDELCLERVEVVNDQRTYTLVPRLVVMGVAREPRFTPERWADFKADVKWFCDTDGPKRLAEMLKDHGYNATPFNTALLRVVSNAFSVREPAERLLPLLVDTGFLGGSVLLVGWAFGLGRALAVGIFLALFFGLENFHVGGLLRFDWLFATIAAVCLHRRERYGLAGVALGYAAMVRIFPAFLLLGPGLRLVRTLLAERRLERDVLRMGATFTLVCALAFPLGALGGRGFEAWPEFVRNMAHHSGEHYLGPLRLGLQKVFVFDWARLEEPDGKAVRRALFEQREGAFRVAQALGVLLLALALWRRRREDEMALGMALAFFAVVLSRYYWALWCLFLLVHVAEAPARRWAGTLVDFGAVLFTLVFFVSRAAGAARAEQFQHANTYMLVFLVALLGGYVAFDALSRLARGTAAASVAPPPP